VRLSAAEIDADSAVHRILACNFARVGSCGLLALSGATRCWPVHFSTEEDAVHGAALVIRGGHYPWLIEGPGVRLDATEIGRRCEPILQLFRR
jgi:hypothetical protein